MRGEFYKLGAKLHSAPRGRVLNTEAKIGGIPAYFKSINQPIVQIKNRRSVYLKQSLCLFQTEPLFEINTGSIKSVTTDVRMDYFSG